MIVSTILYIYIFNKLVLLIVFHSHHHASCIVYVFCYSHGDHRVNEIEMGMITLPQFSWDINMEYEQR